MLRGCPLSSTQVACVDLARGFAILERSGGASPTMLESLTIVFAHQLELAGGSADTLTGLIDRLDAVATRTPKP